jgi:hypothetical protein
MPHSVRAAFRRTVPDGVREGNGPPRRDGIVSSGRAQLQGLPRRFP